MNNQQQARRIVTTRSEHICEQCGGAYAAEWHHRQNRSQGGHWTPANGLHLCRPCHRHITEHPAEAYAHGWMVRRGDEPTAIPVMYRHRLARLDENGEVTYLEGTSIERHPHDPRENSRRRPAHRSTVHQQ